MKLRIPQEITVVLATLQKAGFAAYLVGGCVRDLLRGVEPKDWDVATGAKPEEVLRVFPDGVYENRFGTVIVPLKSEESRTTADGEGQKATSVEITTFRAEEKYSDRRHPDQIRFTKTIEEDLSRRDFTINAMAVALPTADRVSHGAKDDTPYAIRHTQIIDLFGGQDDLKAKVIRAVGQPEDRFREDALRLMRAVRFATQLDFSIESATATAIKAHADLIKEIAQERIRDELIKMVEADRPERGILLLEEVGLLRHILPELTEGIGVMQNKHHIYTVFEHNVYSLMYAAKYGYSLAVRIASLLHDVGKPRVKHGEGPEATFYNHDIIGSRMAARMLERLRFPRGLSAKVVALIRHHLFFYDVGVVTESSVRRLLRRVGPENMAELIQVRIAERKGSGVPKARPYRLRHLEFMIEKVGRHPLAVTMLAVNGNDIMGLTGVKPGPRIGWMLNALLEAVLDDPALNTREHLISRVRELNALSDGELRALGEKGKEKKEELEGKEEEKIKARHWVR
ncbi:MAG: HD domain-containing protein [bacterium]|nr:HD domain-containing protein [bacterium]MDZ4295899.1 HD domain-containing protein [Patescibacteria group bacterium]